MDRIIIDNLRIYAHHGVFAEEKEQGQFFYVNAILYTDTRNAGLADDLSLSTNYGEVCHFITGWMQEKTYNLIESVAEHLAEEILLKFSFIQKLDLEIRKPDAPIGLPFSSVSVRITRRWHEVYLALGSNMGDREAYLKKGMEELRQNKAVQLLKLGKIIETEPYGGVKQGKFLNTVIQIRTLLSPGELLTFLHEIEAAADRVRKEHWGPRTLDIDILFYDKMVYEDEELIIPHVDMENRRFVLEPMCSIAPNFRHPILGKTMTQLLHLLEE